jgi:isoquinoline 1-oxidoreductase subunit beta
MTTFEPARPSRRDLLMRGVAVAVGLVIGFHRPDPGARAQSAPPDGSFMPNAFIRITTDDTVTIFANHFKSDDGVHSALAMMVAEELDADLEQMRVEPVPANSELHINLTCGDQGISGSKRCGDSWDQYRRAGAIARAMLVTAAATKWEVSTSEITVERGIVRHTASGLEATFGTLAPVASVMPVPTEVVLKEQRG